MQIKQQITEILKRDPSNPPTTLLEKLPVPERRKLIQKYQVWNTNEVAVLRKPEKTTKPASGKEVRCSRVDARQIHSHEQQIEAQRQRH